MLTVHRVNAPCDYPGAPNSIANDERALISQVITNSGVSTIHKTDGHKIHCVHEGIHVSNCHALDATSYYLPENIRPKVV